MKAKKTNIKKKTPDFQGGEVYNKDMAQSSKTRHHYYLYGPNEKILDKVVSLLAKEKPGKLLDVGTGTGLLCEKLAKLDFSVSGCDLDPSQFKAKGIPIKKADLNKKLPYPNASFNYVTCSEVLEHLENPWQACREMARVLKKGGVLILTIPNFTNLISRMVFFSRGNFRYFDDWTWENWGHINPITFTELSKISASVGLKIEVTTTQEEIGQPYRTGLYWLHKIAEKTFRSFKMTFWKKDPRDQTLPMLESRALLFGENLIIKCRKTD